jgi:hypothetical protein
MGEELRSTFHILTSSTFYNHIDGALVIMKRTTNLRFYLRRRVLGDPKTCTETKTRVLEEIVAIKKSSKPRLTPKPKNINLYTLKTHFPEFLSADASAERNSGKWVFNV